MCEAIRSVGQPCSVSHFCSESAPRFLRRGDLITVRSGDVVHTYEVVRTRKTSFRSTESLAAQRAPVPGRPGEDATQAMLTLSTCATPEDHAVGNFWSDEFGNPEHRIDKIAVLRSSRPAS